MYVTNQHHINNFNLAAETGYILFKFGEHSAYWHGVI